MAREPLDATRVSGYFEAMFGGGQVMAIVRGHEPAQTVARCELAWSAGIDVVEVPIQTPDAVASLRAAVTAARAVGREIGVGTVVSLEQVTVAAHEGAAFAVAPGFDPAIVAACLAHGLPHLPGVATASEIQSAGRLGLTWLKAFPARQLTPGWFAAMLAPFPQVQLVATGGIGPDNAQEFLDVGARVVAVGSSLGDREQMRQLTGLGPRSRRDGR